jgi:hypothetical protein
MQGPVLWLVMTPAVLLFSMGIGKVIRHLLKTRSRYVIGW